MTTGHCNCGGVVFEITAPLAPGSLCHCGQCRRQAGHAWASASIPQTALIFISDDTLTWFEASPAARRGFCNRCGSFLFWQHKEEDTISVSLGVLDPPTETRIARHIFTADKGDYYDIDGDLPQRDR